MSNRQANARMTAGHNDLWMNRPDLFEAIGKKWLATVDRYSGYAWLK